MSKTLPEPIISGSSHLIPKEGLPYPLLKWEPLPSIIKSDGTKLMKWDGLNDPIRAAVPGGWLVMLSNKQGITFVPDEGHGW